MMRREGVDVNNYNNFIRGDVLKMLMTLIDYFKYMNVDDHDICLNFFKA